MKELFATGLPVYGYCSDHGRGGQLTRGGSIEGMNKTEGTALASSCDRVCVAKGKWIAVPRAKK